jgi:hypothetical protein
MAKVYVINDMNHNFDKAEKHGELVYVTTGKVPIFKTDVAKSMIGDGLKGFNIREDYLLVSGPAILCMLAALLVVDGDVPIQTLVFDAKIQDYVVRHIAI